MNKNQSIKFFSGQATRYLADQIAQSYGIPIGKSSITYYSDGEYQASYDDSVRGSTVFIFQSTFPPTDNLFELLLMIDAAHRASAYKVVAVIPYFGWARQDRKDKPRVSIGAKLVANLLTAAKVDRVMTMDLHADQIQGFFDVPVDHLFSSTLFIPYINKLNLDNLAFASPDMGGAKRANAYSRHMDASLVVCHKNRERANEVGSITVIGDVKGKNVIILDDMIDTAGTIVAAADMIMSGGAKSVRAFASHPVLSGPAYDRIAKSSLTEVVVTNSIPLRQGEDTSKIKVISVADLFANVIGKVYNCQSISTSFLM